MFGELIGIWIRRNFEDQFAKHIRPSSFRIVELGPGRGSLMVDMLRVFSLLLGFILFYYHRK